MDSKGNEKPERLFQSATSKWPKVNWDLEAFRKHLNDETIKYPDDLYLGGAAGWRLKTAWETIEAELGPPTQRVLRRQPIADCSVDELWSDAIAKLLDADPNCAVLPNGQHPARIIHYRGRVPLLNYLILIAKRVAIQRQRQARPALTLEYAREGGESSRELADPKAAAPDAEQIEAEQTIKMRDALTAAYGRLSAEQQFLIMMVYRQRMKQKDAGALLQWSEFKTTRSLSAAMARLRESLSELKDIPWTPAMASAWEECVNMQCWKPADDLQLTRQATSKPLAEARRPSPANAKGNARKPDEPIAEK